MDILDEVIENICKNSISRVNLLNNFHQVAVAIDEMIDNGLVFNTDSENIEMRLSMKEAKQNNTNNEGGYFSSVFFFKFSKLYKKLNNNLIQNNLLDFSKSQKYTFPKYAIIKQI
jgi:hypothetical protein